MSTSSASDAATRGGTEKGLARVAQSLAAWTEKWFPYAYIFALVGVVVISLAAMLNGASPVAIVDAFGTGFWDLTAFTLQMAMVGLTGYGPKHWQADEETAGVSPPGK